MTSWSRRSRTALALVAMFLLACQLGSVVLAKDICDDGGANPAPVTPAPTTLVPTKTTNAPAPVPSPTNQPSVPVPTTLVPTPTAAVPTQPVPTQPVATKPTPTTSAPTPTPTAPSPTTPTPTPTTSAPTPIPTTPSPTKPTPTTPMPTPSQTTSTPTPSPTTLAPTPSPTIPVPTPLPTIVEPTPSPTTLAPTPSPTPAPGPLCGKQLKQIYYHGFDIVELKLETLDECCAACNAEPKCKLYTYFYSKTTGVVKCLLKTQAGEKTNYGDSQSVIAVSAFANRPTPSPTTLAPTPSPTSEPVCMIPTGQYCGNAQGALCCDATSYCQPWNSEYYQCIGVPDGCSGLETDVDYYGGDLRSVSHVLPWDCCRLCQETDGCAVYTFVNLDPSGPTCYLKSSSAGRVRKVGALSGHRTNASPLPTPIPLALTPSVAPVAP